MGTLSPMNCFKIGSLQWTWGTNPIGEGFKRLLQHKSSPEHIIVGGTANVVGPVATMKHFGQELGQLLVRTKLFADALSRLVAEGQVARLEAHRSRVPHKRTDVCRLFHDLFAAIVKVDGEDNHNRNTGGNYDNSLYFSH